MKFGFVAQPVHQSAGDRSNLWKHQECCMHGFGRNRLDAHGMADFVSDRPNLQRKGGPVRFKALPELGQKPPLFAFEKSPQTIQNALDPPVSQCFRTRQALASVVGTRLARAACRHRPSARMHADRAWPARTYRRRRRTPSRPSPARCAVHRAHTDEVDHLNQSITISAPAS